MSDDPFYATYLGWQSWCIETDSTCLVIDPLFENAVGRGPRHTRMSFVFSHRRQFDFARFGPVDAIVLSHEHEDHFNVPSLARCDRRIPLFVSGLISDAARTLLADMGFAPDYFLAGESRHVGDLTIEFLGPNHLSWGLTDSDEWDTMSYMVDHQRSRASFFSNVDNPITRDMVACLEQRAQRGQRVLSFFEMQVGVDRVIDPTRRGDSHRAPSQASYDCETDLTRLRAGQHITPFAGETIACVDGRAQAVTRSPYLHLLERTDHARPFVPVSDELPAPVCGETELDPGSREELESELRELAQHLYGHPLFRVLLTLDRGQRGDRRTIAFAFAVGAADTVWAYEYRATACQFVRVQKQLCELADYLAVVWLWATDFLMVARCEVEPRAIRPAMIEMRADENLPPLMELVWAFYHPLRFPERVLKQYRVRLAAARDMPVTVHARAVSEQVLG